MCILIFLCIYFTATFWPLSQLLPFLLAQQSSRWPFLEEVSGVGRHSFVLWLQFHFSGGWCPFFWSLLHLCCKIFNWDGTINALLVGSMANHLGGWDMALAVVLFVLLVPILASQAYPNPFNMVDYCFLPFCASFIQLPWSCWSQQCLVHFPFWDNDFSSNQIPCQPVFFHHLHL